MSNFFSLFFVLLQKYLIPFVFAVGLIYLVYGIINYFIIGKNSEDEGRMELGRGLLLKSCTIFTIGLILYGIVALFGWFGNVLTQGTGDGGGKSTGDAGARFNNTNAVLPVPNVPRANDE